MKNTARMKVEQHLLERAQVRTMGAIVPLPKQAPVSIDALATELGIEPRKVKRLARLTSGTNLNPDTAAGVITAALDQLSDPDRVLQVHAQREFDDMVWATDLATWIGLPISEVWFHEDGGWDAIAAAVEHEGIEDYEWTADGICYGDLVAAHNGSSVAWSEFESLTSRQGWIGYITAEKIADDLGVELPWPAKAIINAMDDEVALEDANPEVHD